MKWPKRFLGWTKQLRGLEPQFWVPSHGLGTDSSDASTDSKSASTCSKAGPIKRTDGIIDRHLTKMIRGCVVALLACLAYLEFPHATQTAAYNVYQVVRLRNLYVVQDDGKLAYTFQAQDDSNRAAFQLRRGDRISGTFCPDYEPMFSSGQVLNVLQYEDRHECWELFNQHPKYFIRRNADGSTFYEDKETASSTSPYTAASARQ